MFRTLFNTNFNWPFFFGIGILILLFFPSLSWFSFFAILIVLHQFILLFNSINYLVPIRYLFGSFMCLQMLLGPMLAYNGLDQYQYFMYKMQMPEEVYFAYVIPAVICFIVGLHINAGNFKGEVLDEKRIKLFADNHKGLPYWFIGIGFVSSIVAGFFSSEFAFVFYLLSGFKFVGIFILIMGGKQLKLSEIFLVYGSIILSSLGDAMFHDLLTWLIMLGAVLAIKYKPGVNLKITVSISFLLLVIIIQQVKGTYRAATGQGGIEKFQTAVEKGQENNSLFNFISLAGSNVRINQGFIITNIIKTVPSKVPFSNGEELGQILEAAVLPRILAPDKLKAGDRAIFIKYTQLKLQKGTSMGLSSVGDAYINFGVVGGCIFMFVLGLIYNFALIKMYSFSKKFPVLLLFTTLIFYYPIRPDCELQTILGHFVKSCFLIFVVFTVWKKDFKISVPASWKKYSY